MNVYVYAADIYCEDCGKAIQKRLIRQGKIPENIESFIRYDSDKYPKGPYPNGGGEADYPNHCGAGLDCLNAIHVPVGDHRGYKIGAWLENGLTTDGVEYVRGMIQEGGEVAKLWADYYHDCDLQPKGSTL